MEVCFLASGEPVAVLDATQVEGTTAKAVKQLLAAHVGATRFRQRLFREGDFGEIPDDEVFTSLPTKLQLVVCEFCPPDAEKERQMIFACTNNDLTALEELLKRPQNVTAKDESGETPLHRAAACGHLEAMQLLLEAGADRNACDMFGSTALHFAVVNGHLAVIRFCLNLGLPKINRMMKVQLHCTLQPRKVTLL